MKWHVGKCGNLLAAPWVVHAPDGSYVGRYNTWRTAMSWTRIGDVVESWLESLTA